MLLVVTPLGFSEDSEDNQMAMSLIQAKIEHYQMQGKGVPRYEKHIKLLQDSLDEFAAHHEIVAEFGRDPRRNAILCRENTAEEDAYKQRFQAGGATTSATETRVTHNSERHEWTKTDD